MMKCTVVAGSPNVVLYGAWFSVPLFCYKDVSRKERGRQESITPKGQRQGDAKGGFRTQQRDGNNLNAARNTQEQ